MASVSRSTLLRQAQLLSSSKRLFVPKTAPLRSNGPILAALSRQPRTTVWSTRTAFAPFSTSSQRKILPPGPQVIEGGVNQPAPLLKQDSLHGSYHWTFERLLSVGLVPLTVAPFAAGSLNPALDAALVFGLLVHTHFGFQYVCSGGAKTQYTNGNIDLLSSITFLPTDILALENYSCGA